MDADIRLAFRAVALEDRDPAVSEALWDASNTVAKAQSALFAIALTDDIQQARYLAATAIQALRQARCQ